MITFAVLVWFTMKYVWPPLISALEERKRKIADGLAAAEHGAHELQLAQKKAVDVIREARQQAVEIVEQANKRARAIEEEAKQKGAEERERIVAAGHSEIEREVQAARQKLQAQVVTLALAGAEKVLEKEVSPANHTVLLEKLAAQL